MPDQVIRLSKSQTEDLQTVCEIGPDVLARIATAVEKLPITIRKEKIEAAVAAQVAQGQVEPLVRMLFGIAILNRRNFVGASRLLDSLSLPAHWNDTQKAKWQECRPALERLVSSEPVVLATKAEDLSIDVERYCVGARIITDVRPVFDLQRDQIAGSTLRQTLRLEFMSMTDGAISSVSIGLDANDIARLKKECEEATHKADVIRKMLTKSGLIEIIIPGEEPQ